MRCLMVVGWGTGAPDIIWRQSLHTEILTGKQLRRTRDNKKQLCQIVPEYQAARSPQYLISLKKFLRKLIHKKKNIHVNLRASRERAITPEKKIWQHSFLIGVLST